MAKDTDTVSYARYVEVCDLADNLLEFINITMDQLTDPNTKPGTFIKIGLRTFEMNELANKVLSGNDSK